MSEELAWAAGFIDGEGCFSINRNKGHKRPLLTVSQAISDGEEIAEVLLRLQATLPVKSAIYDKRYPSPRWRQRHTLTIGGYENVKTCYELLRPWLCTVKRKQAERVLAEYETQKAESTARRKMFCRNGHPRTDKDTYWYQGKHPQCLVCRRELHARKKGGGVNGEGERKAA